MRGNFDSIPWQGLRKPEMIANERSAVECDVGDDHHKDNTKCRKLFVVMPGSTITRKRTIESSLGAGLQLNYESEQSQTRGLLQLLKVEDVAGGRADGRVSREGERKEGRNGI